MKNVKIFVLGVFCCLSLMLNCCFECSAATKLNKKYRVSSDDISGVEEVEFNSYGKYKFTVSFDMCTEEYEEDDVGYGKTLKLYFSQIVDDETHSTGTGDIWEWKIPYGETKTFTHILEPGDYEIMIMNLDEYSVEYTYKISSVKQKSVSFSKAKKKLKSYAIKNALSYKSTKSRASLYGPYLSGTDSKSDYVIGCGMNPVLEVVKKGTSSYVQYRFYGRFVCYTYYEDDDLAPDELIFKSSKGKVSFEVKNKKEKNKYDKKSKAYRDVSDWECIVCSRYSSEKQMNKLIKVINGKNLTIKLSGENGAYYKFNTNSNKKYWAKQVQDMKKMKKMYE